MDVFMGEEEGRGPDLGGFNINIYLSSISHFREVKLRFLQIVLTKSWRELIIQCY